MNLSEKIKEQYVRFPNGDVAKFGDVHDEENCAAYAVELGDWAGFNKGEIHQTEYLQDRRTVGGMTTARIGYVAATKTQVISERDFYEALAENIIECAKLNRDSDAFFLPFKPTEERRAMLFVLMKRAHVNGIVI